MSKAYPGLDGSGAGGRSYMAIPGPSVVPDRVLAAMMKPSPDIYAQTMVDLARDVATDLKALAGCSGHVAMYLGNGHAAWEAASANVFSPGDKCLLLATGHFGLGWVTVLEGIGVDVEVMDFGKTSAVDFAQVAERLRQDSAGQIRAVAMVHTDTSTSVRTEAAGLRAALDKTGHPALLLVDGVCSFGCDEFDMDACGADVFITACQKGLMVPAGLCFVFFSDRALRDCAGARCRSRYWDWTGRAAANAGWEFWYGTPPTQLIWALREALDMFAEEGKAQVFARHKMIARAWWVAMEHWGTGGALRLNLTDEAIRSHAVTAAKLDAPDATRLRHWLRENCGVVLGVSLGMASPEDPEWHGYFRVGHMGHLNPAMALGAIGSVEAGLKALGIAHAAGGVTAAAEVIAGGL